MASYIIPKLCLVFIVICTFLQLQSHLQTKSNLHMYFYLSKTVGDPLNSEKLNCTTIVLSFDQIAGNERETLQNFSLFRQTFRWQFSRGNKSCPNELKFCEVSRNYKFRFQISTLTLEKHKSFIPKKILSVPCTMDSSFFSQKMATWRPNSPHQRLWS